MVLRLKVGVAPLGEVVDDVWRVVAGVFLKTLSPFFLCRKNQEVALPRLTFTDCRDLVHGNGLENQQQHETKFSQHAASCVKVFSEELRESCIP